MSPLRSVTALASLTALVVVGASCTGQTTATGWDEEDTTPNAASVAAKCAVADGATLPVPDETTFLGLLAGRWYRCDASSPAIGAAPAAIELTSDKQWYTLAPDYHRRLRTQVPRRVKAGPS